MAYITNYNASRILRQADLRGMKISERGIFKKSIYFFNWYEEMFLKVYQEMLENPSQFFGKVYQKVQREADDFTFVSPPRPPAYHEKLDCSLLHSDYKNFEIPQEITQQGEGKVLEFRKWFLTVQNLYEQDPAAFQMRLQAKFGILVPLSEIGISNSGVAEVENQSLDQLIQRIFKLLDEARVFIKSSPENQQILSPFNQKYSFLGLRDEPLEKNLTPFSDDVVKAKMNEFEMNFKRPVKNLLLEYYRMTLNPDLTFDGDLLEGVGFVPCSQCSEKAGKIVMIL